MITIYNKPIMRHISIHPISKEDTIFMKGIAILLIVLHNYYRWINPPTGENEFYFSSDYINKSCFIIKSAPIEFIKVFFNFFGHYGVQVFIFLSAYGLTLSYHKNKTSYIGFIYHRFDKIYPSFILAVIFYMVFNIITGIGIASNELSSIGIKLTLFSNFIPGESLAVCGPWWFYSLIFQFYLLFPGFMWINKKFGNIGLIIITIVSYFLTIKLYPPLTKVSLNPLMMFIGHIPKFCLGILVINVKNFRIPLWTFFLAVII